MFLGLGNRRCILGMEVQCSAQRNMNCQDKPECKGAVRALLWIGHSID